MHAVPKASGSLLAFTVLGLPAEAADPLSPAACLAAPRITPIGLVDDFARSLDEERRREEERFREETQRLRQQVERALPQFPPAPPIPPPGEILEKWRQEINNAGIGGPPDVQRLLAQGANVVQILGGPPVQAVTDLLGQENGPLAAAGRELVSAAGELSDAGQAIGRFAEAQITGMGTIITDAQRRFAEGKIVDGLWHIIGDMIGNTARNGLDATQESALLSIAANAAATTAGGPMGAAALAAAQTYQRTGGNINAALIAGVQAYAIKDVGTNVAAMPSGTITEVFQKAAATGAMAGVAVGASGGSPEEMSKAFVNAGGAVLVQSAQSYADREYVRPAVERVDQMCMSGSENGCGQVRQWLQTQQQRVQDAQRRYEVQRQRLQRLGQWTQDRQRELNAVRDRALAEARARTVSPCNRVLMTPDRQWLISWDDRRVRHLAAGEPFAVLTPVTAGTPMARTVEQIRQVAAGHVPPTLSPGRTNPGIPGMEASARWVAFSDVGARTSFFTDAGSGARSTTPAVGETLQAAGNVFVRPAPHFWRQKIGVLKRGEQVVVQEVRSVPAGAHTQIWIRVKPAT